MAEELKGDAPEPKEPSQQTGEYVIDPKVKQRQDLLGEAIKICVAETENLQIQVFVWSLICISIIICSIFLSITLLMNIELPCCWTWQVVYYTAIRLTIISAIFTFASFCFKMLRSSLHMYQRNKHREVLIKSAPHFVEALINPEGTDAIYNKIIDSVIHFGNIGILNKEGEIKSNKYSNELLEKILHSLRK